MNAQMGMQPIPESSLADEMYGPFMWGDVDLFERLVEVSTSVLEVAPECVGMSVSLREHGVTLTLVATEHRIALLDAVQYVDGGPCADAMRDDTVVSVDDRVTMCHEWSTFAEATIRNGIESTLSLPVPWEGSAAIGFNLYGATPTTFEGHHDALAEILGAWAGGAVVDADLPFRSLRLASRAPEILQETTELAVVSVMLSRARDLELDEAERRLRDAASRAAIPLRDLLEIMREVLPEP